MAKKFKFEFERGGSLIADACAVSYTHLDVYKRQLIMNVYCHYLIKTSIFPPAERPMANVPNSARKKIKNSIIFVLTFF